MKISPIARNVGNKVKQSYANLKTARKQAKEVSEYIAEQKNHGKFKQQLNTEINTAKYISKQINTKNLPFIMGGLGLLIPVPIAAPALFVVGGAISLGIKAYKKFVK